MKRSYSGASGGVGAVYAWEGNRSVGQGRMEITESVQPSRITLKLEFLKPFEAHNAAEFALERHGATTRVTWAMHGPSPFPRFCRCSLASWCCATRSARHAIDFR